MATITLSVPKELKEKLEQNKFINWSEVARRAFIEQLKDLIELNAIKDARKIADLKGYENKNFNKTYVRELNEISKNTKKRKTTIDELNKLMSI